MAEEMGQISYVFDGVLRVAKAQGVRNIKRLPHGWYYRLDDTWEWIVNGTLEPITVTPSGTMGATVPPFTAAVWYHGWLAGLFSPFEGIFAAGEGANEETFLAAIEAALNA